ncbi:hypothetical protein TWF696_002146 [Orbilia brochopaga]|uniref:F-box domain-containing protein n=1 Tax=Orbilia brochopaga TaxID=3140254 RepID=A0AAV9U3J9_9PEZI
MSTPGLLKFPFELVREVALYLDRPSLKALRLAFVDKVISTVTAHILFDTIAFRLGVENSDFVAWKKRLSTAQSLMCMERNPRVDPSPDGSEFQSFFWDHTRTLVLDTRYPILVSDKIREIDELSWDGDFITRTGKNDQPGVSFMGMKAVEMYYRFLRRVLQTANHLCTIRWLTSSELPSKLHAMVAKLLCAEVKPRKISLEVTMILKNSSRLRFYSDELSNLTRLSVRFMDHSGMDVMRLRDSDCLASIIGRSKGLDHFMLDLQKCRGMIGWWAPISKALKAVEKLQSFEFYSRITPTPILAPEMVKRLKRLVLNKQGGSFPVPEEIWSELQLESFGTCAYSPLVQRMLTSSGQNLKELEIWGLERGPFIDNLAVDFWTKVVGKHSSTLKRLAVHVDELDFDSDWCWAEEGWNPAFWAIARCRQLEELKLGMLPTERLSDLVETVVEPCPNLRLITFDYIGYQIVRPAQEMYTELCLFMSERPVYKNRELDLVFENRVGPGSISSKDWDQRLCRNFILPDFPDPYAPPKWHDTLFKIWRLSEMDSRTGTKEKLFVFDRLDTVYALDDGADEGWRHYETHRGYFPAAINEFKRNREPETGHFINYRRRATK